MFEYINMYKTKYYTLKNVKIHCKNTFNYTYTLKTICKKSFFLFYNEMKSINKFYLQAATKVKIKINQLRYNFYLRVIF